MSHLTLLTLTAEFSILMIGGVFAATPNPLNGQHLRVIWARWKGNPNGISGPLKGGVVLEYMSARMNFTYEMVRVIENTLEPLENGRGLYSYLWDQQCDFLIHDMLPTVQRNKIVDLTLPWYYDYFAFLIPVPVETANINAVVKPFQWPIWLGLGVSILCVIAVLILMQRYLEFRSPTELGNINNTNERTNARWETGKQYLYVFGNLLSQGGPCISRRLPFRLVAGVWTLAAFIFVQAYTSTLFTYVITPINHPLINSIYDIVDSSDINLLVRIGTLDNIISENSNRSSLYKKLKRNLDTFKNSRCLFFPDCVKLITPGSRNVYIDSRSYLKDAIRSDFLKTKKCNLQLAQNGFSSIMSTFALPKNSPYTGRISLGLLELQQTGIIDYWDLWFRPMPRQCNGEAKNRGKAPQKNSSLSLKNLTGAFIVLLVGFCLSFLAFIGEKIVSVSTVRLHRRQTL